MKKVLKSALSLILAITFVFSSAMVGLVELDFGNLFAVKASAANEYELLFQINEDGNSYSVCGIQFGDPVEIQVVIPSSYNGLPVTKINNDAFGYCENITSVVIPNSVKSIGDCAFYYCTGLTSVVIPDSVNNIGKQAFRLCTSLNSITIPDGVTLGLDVFLDTGYYNNRSNWINGVLYIGNHIIETDGTSSGSLVIKEGTLSIPDSAFVGCGNITSVTIPESVTSIGNRAFEGCANLQSVTIPEGVMSVGEYAFSGCEGLQTVKIPTTLESIGTAAFENCFCLSYVYINDIASWCNISFGNLNSNPLGYASYLYVGGVLITDLVVPQTVAVIPACAFSCLNIETVTLSNNVKSIGECAFADCTNLKSINLPSGLETIGKAAFASCENLTSIVIPDGITTIEDSTFYLCTSLSSVSIPASVTSIGRRSFLGCSSLESVTIPGDSTTIGICGLGYTTESTKNNYFTIYGVKYTDVEQYAIDNGFTFIEIEGSHNHTISDWIIDVSPSCTQEGLKHKECVFCNVVTESEILPAKGHSLDTSNKCTNCGEQFGEPLKNYVIYICDVETGGPVSGAVVNLGGIIRTTDSTGAARYQLETYDATTLSIVADTYPDYPTSSYIPNNQNADYIYLTSDESDIYGAWCNDVDVINSTTKINAKIDSLVAEIVVVGRAKANILKYELVQDSVVIAESDDGSFSVPNTSFKLGANKPIYVRMYTDGTEGNNVFERKLNIKVIGFVLNFVTDLKGILPFMNGFTLTFSDDMPCFPGVEMNFPVPFLKDSEVSLYYDNDNVIVTYGIEKEFGPDNDLRDTPHNTLVKLVHSWFKGKRNDKDNEVHASFALVVTYDEDGISDICGQINVGFNLKHDDGITHMWGVVPIRVEYELTASGEVAITEIRYDKTQHQLHADYELPLEGGIAVLGGLGFEGVTFGGYGKLGLKITLDSDYVNEFKNVTVYGELGVYLKLKIWFVVNIDKKWPLASYDFWSKDGILEDSSALLYSADSYEIDTRDYLQNRTPWLNSALMSNDSKNVLLQDSTYTAIEPRIVTCGDTVMMLFLDDDGSVGYNYQHLYYSIYDKASGGWSEPLRVDNNNRCDADFDVYADASSIYVAYTELDPIPDGAEVDMDFIGTSDIVVAQYSFSDDRFINYTNLTDNDSVDALPKINGTDDGVVVSWVNNCTNDVFFQNANNVVYFSSLNGQMWSAPTALTDRGATVTSMSVGSIGGKTYIAIINDDDCSLGTAHDRVLRLVDLNGNVTEIETETDVNAAVQFVEFNGENQLVWYNNRNLYHIGSVDDTPEYLFGSAVSGLTDVYKFIQTGENSYAVIFTKNELVENGEGETLNGSSLYGIFYNNGEWGNVVPVTQNEAGYYVDAYDVCMCDGKMLVPYINSLVAITETDVKITSAFMSTTFLPKNDLVVGKVDSLPDDPFDTTAFELYVPVTNNSWQSLNAVSYEVRDLEGNVIQSGTWEKYIESGSTECLTIVIPDELLSVGENYTVCVNPSDWSDSDESNNVADVYLWNTDFAVAASEIVLVGKHEIQYTITNNGNIGGSAILKVYKVSEDESRTLITEKEIGYLDAGASVNGSLTVTDDYYFNGADTGDIVLEVVYEGEEMYVFNDYVKLTIGNIELDETTATDGSSTVLGPVIVNPSITYDKANGNNITVEVTENSWSFVGVSELSSENYSYNNGVLTINCAYLSTLDEGEHVFTLSYSKSDLTTEVIYIVKVTDTSYDDVTISADNLALRYDGYSLELGKDILYYTDSNGTVSAEYSVDNGSTWVSGLPTNIGEYLVKITVAQDDENRYLSSSCTITVTIQKMVRAISVPIVIGDSERQVCFGNSVPTLGKNDGTILYGYSLENDVETVTNWSATGVLPVVDAPTTYYVFAKIINGDMYEDAYSVGYAVEAYIPITHTPSDWIIDSNATCTEDGSKHKECTECGEVLETEVIPATGHTSSDWIVDEDSSCAEGGTKHKECTACGELLETETIPATGVHISSDWIIDSNATCTEDGSKHKECTVCGEILETEVIPATGHTSSEWIIDEDSSCAEGGTKHKECTACGELLEIETIPATGVHISSDWIVDSNATCTEDGSKHKECTVCGEILETAVIPAKGHNEVIDNAVAPTCTTTGKTEGSHCSVCGEVVVAQTIIEATGHTASAWIIDSNATCTEDGSKHKECTVCGEILETGVIPATGHTSSEWIIDEDSSCAEGGTKHKECTACGELLETETIPATGVHILSDWIIDSNATCTEDGSKHKECTVCGETVETVVIPAKGHNEVVDNAVAPTCTTTGKTEGSHCSVCGEVIVAQTIIEATGHTASAWIIDSNATCTEDGSKHKECTVCGETVETEVIPAKGHNEVVDNAVAPTCTTTGKTEGSHCSVCGKVVVAQTTIPATGHKAGDWIFDEYVTCTTGGSKHRECIWCGEVLETVTYPATGHTTGHWIVDSQPTVSTPGSQHKECIDCGKVIETEAIPQLKPATPKVATENALTGVLVKWNAVEGATKYNVYRRQGGYNTWVLVGTTTGTSLTDTRVSSGIYYVYSVRAYNNAGQYSDFVSANTQTRKYMAVPKLKGISNATNGLYITWNPVAGVTNGYRVYRRGAGSTYWTYLGTTKNTYFTDTQVKNNSGEYFRYTVIADGGYHSKFDTTGLYLRRLSNPTLTSAVSNRTGITVKWTPVKGCLGYYVYRKTANSGWVRIAVVNGANASSYVDKTAKKGVTYTYTVRAVCGNVTSYFNSGISCKDRY